MSNSGKVDGDLSRIHGYGDYHPNLVRVEEGHWDSGFLAVGINPEIKLDGWSSLNGTDYRVVYRRGIKGCEVNLPKYVNASKLDIVSSVNSGFSKVLRNWSDIYVGADMNIVNALKSETFEKAELNIIGVMDKFSAHLYLHKKNRILAPKITKRLKSMKKDGTIAKFRKQAGLKSYFDKQ
ncbi:hypothetical protein [Maridesulfovibrio ferrireducens]|uniref:hypothetical protein n=1 Tax=Maridesulfovibrio ferrireducens TaxID=246191 RepID=UPI001A2DA2E0|nr:hypothetical protein [Maridesulfovibrio ferrireducens]MBI9113082.1 hypothetical protein [Maridesulfovibrio ferrireducens]